METADQLQKLLTQALQRVHELETQLDQCRQKLAQNQQLLTEVGLQLLTGPILDTPAASIQRLQEQVLIAGVLADSLREARDFILDMNPQDRVRYDTRHLTQGIQAALDASRRAGIISTEGQT